MEGGKTILLFLILCLALPVNATWWNESWRNKVNVTVVEDLSYARTNDKLQFWYDHNINTANCSNETRVLDSTESVLLPFKISSNNSTACLVEMPFNSSASASTLIVVYFNNSIAPANAPYAGTYGTSKKDEYPMQAYITGSVCKSSGGWPYWLSPNNCANDKAFDSTWSSYARCYANLGTTCDASARYSHQTTSATSLNYKIWDAIISYQATDAVRSEAFNLYLWNYLTSAYDSVTSTKGTLNLTLTSAQIDKYFNTTNMQAKVTLAGQFSLYCNTDFQIHRFMIAYNLKTTRTAVEYAPVVAIPTVAVKIVSDSLLQTKKAILGIGYIGSAIIVTVGFIMLALFGLATRRERLLRRPQ